jgi:pimeloyl-ACP methyl ester carboxylesterase
MSITAHHLVVRDRIGFVQDVIPRRPNGTTVLLIHTAGQSGVQWRGTLGPLAEVGYRLIVPDLPGHGHSEPNAAGAVQDLSDYAEWIVEVVNILGIDKLVAAGCSIGGKIVQDLAARQHEWLIAAVSMCAESGPGKATLHALERELEDIAAPSRSDRTHLGTRAVVGRNVSEQRGSLIARMHCREDPQVSNSDLIGWGSHDIRPQLAAIKCPITFVAGEDDLWVDPRSVQKSAGQVRKGSYVLLPGYGHYPMEEIVEFAPLLDGWISDMISPITS